MWFCNHFGSLDVREALRFGLEFGINADKIAKLEREEREELLDSLNKFPEPDNPYHDLQAEMGFTKHVGEIKSNEELITLRHIDES